MVCAHTTLQHMYIWPERHLIPWIKGEGAKFSLEIYHLTK